MPLLVRALINGFGWKLGFEVGRYVAHRLGISDTSRKQAAQEEAEVEDGEIPGEEPPDAKG